MTRNQKIALGCGGVGCLGLIALVIIGVISWTYIGSSLTTNRNRNRNYNFNLNTNSNSNRDSNANIDSDTNANSESDTSSASSYSNDDKHKLFQAAGMVQDSATVQRVMKKIGLMDQSGVPTADYEPFMKEHISWALRNAQFIISVNTKEKAQAYLDEHLD